MDKTLGQIAFEGQDDSPIGWRVPWSDLSEINKARWGRIAAAVAAAVKEEDARICSELWQVDGQRTANEFAAAIRASIKTEVE